MLFDERTNRTALQINLEEECRTHVGAECDGVEEVAVVGFPKLPEGEEIAAFVVSSSSLTEAALDAHCRTRLAPDKRPRKFVFVPDLPRNANGKILRLELRKQLEQVG